MLKGPVLHHTVLILHPALASRHCSSSFSSPAREPQPSGAATQGYILSIELAQPVALSPWLGSLGPRPAEEEPGLPDQGPFLALRAWICGVSKDPASLLLLLPQALPRRLNGPSPITKARITYPMPRRCLGKVNPGSVGHPEGQTSS